MFLPAGSNCFSILEFLLGFSTGEMLRVLVLDSLYALSIIHTLGYSIRTFIL